MSLSQHRVSSSKTVRPRGPCGARCIGHAVSTWSAVCSEAPHSQFGEGARPHLCMDEWNRPTHAKLLQSFEKDVSSLAATALLPNLKGTGGNDGPKQFGASTFYTSSCKAYSILNKGMSRHSPRHCPVLADFIASQLIRNKRYEADDHKSSRLISQEMSDLCRATTPYPVNISDTFSQRQFTAALRHLKQVKFLAPILPA